LALAFVFDILFIDPLTRPGATFLILAVPTILADLRLSGGDGTPCAQ
jgi:hypothetical protein